MRESARRALAWQVAWAVAAEERAATPSTDGASLAEKTEVDRSVGLGPKLEAGRLWNVVPLRGGMVLRKRERRTQPLAENPC